MVVAEALTAPPVKSFDVGADRDDIAQALREAGGCIIRHFASVEDVHKMEAELRPFLEIDTPWEGSFFPKETRRTHNLVTNSPTFREKGIMHPLHQDMVKRFLTTKNWFWQGDRTVKATSHPQLMNTVCFSIRPGARAQDLHRDDWTYHQINPSITQFEDRETALGLFIAGKPATRMNGATRFIPGSHLWAHGQKPIDNLAAQAVLDAGDAFLMFGSCYHGGGANMTADEERLLFSCFSTRGWLRQEENYYLSVPLDVAKTFSLELQKFIGYDISEPFLGWVGNNNPRCVLDPSLVGNKDMTGRDD